MRALLGVLAAFVVAFGVGIWWSGRDTTQYSSGFEEEAFQRLEPGMPVAEVYALLGRPLATRREGGVQRWCYSPADMRQRDSSDTRAANSILDSCVRFDKAGLAIDVSGEHLDRIRPGMTTDDVLALLGEPARRIPPAHETLHYSQPGGEGLFRARIVALDEHRRISEVISYQFYD